MMKKFILLIVILFVLILAASTPITRTEAAPAAAISLSKLKAIHAEPIRWRLRRSQRPSGIAVFVVPGLYWGPAWWDPNYSKLCWREIQPCKNCAKNWAYTC
jgi:hypothetical protein